MLKGWVKATFETDSDGFRVDGWHLDKDLLVKGNKEYSEYSCVFLPSEINQWSDSTTGTAQEVRVMNTINANVLSGPESVNVKVKSAVS